MKFISQNVALIQYNDLINNSISFPDVYDVSFTLNSNLIYPQTSFYENIQTFYFQNIKQNDVLHAFFHKQIKGIKGNKNFIISPSFIVNNPNSIHLFSNNYQPKLNNPSQNTELNNLSKEDNTFVKMFTSNHISMERINNNNVFYISFIPQKTTGSFQIVIKNFNEPLQLQFLFYDKSDNLIEKVNSNIIEPYIENSVENLEYSSSTSSETQIEYWTSILEIDQSLHDKFLQLGRIENENGIVFNELKWKCRYSIYREGSYVLWRDYSPTIIFKINEPPTSPENINLV